MNIFDMDTKFISEVVELEKEIFKDPYSEEIIRKIKTYEMYDFLVYFDEKVHGYAILNTVLDESELFRIAVTSNSRRQNIANILLEKLVERSRQKNIAKIHLEVRQSNISAINLYKKNGFLPVGTRKNYYSDPKEDAILMTLEV